MFSEGFKVFQHSSKSVLRTTFFNRIFKKKIKTPLNMFSWCFLSYKVFLALFDIWADNRMFEPRTGFSRISQKASKHVLLVFSGCFNGFFFSIVRHLSREPDFWAENQIFKKFLKSLKTCWVGVFWVFHGFFFSIVRHLSREPDFLAENSVFKTFFKSL